MKIFLIVEGQTEKKALPDFIKRWLDPRLQKRVGLSVVSCGGNQKLVNDIERKARNILGDPKVIGVIGLLDLYADPITKPTGAPICERYDAGVKHFQDMVDDKRFRMHYAVHETEAWLFSDSTIFPDTVQPGLPGGNPEGIDSGNPPSKRLDSLYDRTLRRNYREIVDGNALFTKLNPEIDPAVSTIDSPSAAWG